MQQDRSARMETLVRTAARARATGDFRGALAVADQAARERLAHPVLLRIQAEALIAAGRFADAGRLLNAALSLAPNDAPTITDIGRLLMAESRTEDAIQAFKAAVTIRPNLPDAWFELACAHEFAGHDDDAQTAYLKAGELAPNEAGPPAGLASIAVRQGKYDEARSHAEKALGLCDGHPVASLALATADRNQRNFDAARVRLEALLDRKSLNDELSRVALGVLGDALDGVGRTTDAFAAYTRMNELILRLHAPRFGERGPVENHLHFVQRLTSWFERQDPSIWSEPMQATGRPGPVRRHVFVLGYPRSGTTLVENILASLPDVRALEEAPTLTDADLAFLRDDESLDRLSHLDPAVAEQMRAAYWTRVRAEVPDVDGKTFVDMAPLNGVKLPMIARLFPQAIVVLCRRDPRDVVLSCFKRNFRVNASTYQFTSLDSTARHYDAVQRLMDLHLQALPLPVHVVDYSKLVADFDATTRALADFVGVPWSAEMREFNRTAAERNVRTASAPQVRQGLFDGTRQWLGYRDQMESVLPVLERWVVKFGYEI